MDRRWVAGVVALALMGAGLSGCRQDGAAPAASTAVSSSRVSSSSSPTSSDTSTSPSPASSEDPLFTEAKQVHLTFVQQMVALDRAGGADELPAGMKAVVGGDFEKALENGYAEMKVQNFRETTNASWSVTDVWPIKADGGHVIGLGACVDFTRFHYASPDGSRDGGGVMRKDMVQLSRRGGSLVITDGTSVKVGRCER